MTTLELNVKAKPSADPETYLKVGTRIKVTLMHTVYVVFVAQVSADLDAMLVFPPGSPTYPGMALSYQTTKMVQIPNLNVFTYGVRLSELKKFFKHDHTTTWEVL